MTRRRSARRAASTFSLTPPIGKISPVSVISSVIAVSLRIARLVETEARAVAMVIQADRPPWESHLPARGCVRQHP